MGPVEFLSIGASLLAFLPLIALLGWAAWVTMTLKEIKRRLPQTSER